MIFSYNDWIKGDLPDVSVLYFFVLTLELMVIVKKTYPTLVSPCPPANLVGFLRCKPAIKLVSGSVLHSLLLDLRFERKVENQPHSVQQSVHLSRSSLSAGLRNPSGLAADLPLHPAHLDLLQSNCGALLAYGQHHNVVRYLGAYLAIPRDSDRLAAGLQEHSGQAPGQAAAGQAPADR